MTAELFPCLLPGCVIDEIEQGEQGLIISAHVSGSMATCPTCEQSSMRVHHSNTRSPSDLPLGEQAVRLRLQVRRFRCRNPARARQTFVERLAELVPVHAQCAARLTRIMREVGFALGGEVGVFVADVTSADECRAMVEAAQARCGSPNILVNNVAISTPGTVVTVSEEDWDRTLDVNLKSMMLAARSVVPAMIEAGGGSIVNISSTEAYRAGSVGPIIAYNAAKGGVISLTTAMAVHHGRDNVRVNCIAPGFLYTPLIAPRLTEETRELRRQAATLGTED